MKEKLLRKAKARGYSEFSIDNPKTWCEKMQWLQLYDDVDLRAFCADKIRIHDYSMRKLGKDICVPIIKTYDDPNCLKFSELPNQFVLKCNHGYAYNIICKDKSTASEDECRKKLSDWLKIGFGEASLEPHYLRIERKCFSEKYLENNGFNSITDYKFLCFNGVPTYIQILNDRGTKDFHLNYYDMDFNFVNICRRDVANNASKIDKKPLCFSEMKEYARKLSEDFRFVRVDFYEVDGIVYLGELTFTPATGFIRWTDDSIDGKFGEMIKL